MLGKSLRATIGVPLSLHEEAGACEVLPYHSVRWREPTEGEELFERYLADHGYGAPEHEPDLGVAKPPDYVLLRDGHHCGREVKEFAPETSVLPGQPGLRVYRT